MEITPCSSKHHVHSRPCSSVDNLRIHTKSFNQAPNHNSCLYDTYKLNVGCFHNDSSTNLKSGTIYTNVPSHKLVQAPVPICTHMAWLMDSGSQLSPGLRDSRSSRVMP